MFDGMDWTPLSFVLSAVALLWNGATWLYIQVQKKHAATDKQVTDLDKRLTVVETDVKTAPGRKEWSATREDIAAIRGGVQTAAAEIKGLGAGLKRVESQVSLLLENELRGDKRP